MYSQDPPQQDEIVERMYRGSRYDGVRIADAEAAVWAESNPQANRLLDFAAAAAMDEE